MTDQSERTLRPPPRPPGEHRVWPGPSPTGSTDRCPRSAHPGRPLRPRGAPSAPPAHTLRRHPAAALRTRPAARRRARHRRRHLGRARQLGDRVGGLTVLTDPSGPAASSARPPGSPRSASPWSALPRVDAVVISHNHYDHLDAPTLRRLPRDTPVFVPAGLGRLVPPPPLHPGHRTGLVGGGRTERRPLRLRPRPPLVQAHPHRHLPLPVGRLGPHRRRDGQRVYFAGDTGYGHWFARIGRALPGHRPRPPADRRVRPALVAQRRPPDPEEAVRAVRDLGARRDGPHALGDVPAVRRAGRSNR